VTAPPCKALPVEGKFVSVNGIKPYRGVEVQVHSFITPGLKGIEWYVSCLGSFTPVDIPPTHPMNRRINPLTPELNL